MGKGVFITTILVSLFILTARCGNMSGLGESSSSGGQVNLVIKNPDPNSYGTADAVLDSDLIAGKANIPKASINSGTLTISAADMTTLTHTFSVDPNASSITINNLTIPVGKNRTFTVDISDTDETTNKITIGHKGSGSFDISAGANSISLAPQFKNLASDQSDGIHFIRFNEENTTQTKITIGFGSTLTAVQMRDLRCIIEADGDGTRTTPCAIDSNQSSGLTTGTKCDGYILVRGEQINLLHLYTGVLMHSK